MKYLPFILFAILCVGVLTIGSKDNKSNYDYLRVHIRADSNAECDQAVKYLIKDGDSSNITSGATNAGFHINLNGENNFLAPIEDSSLNPFSGWVLINGNEQIILSSGQTLYLSSILTEEFLLEYVKDGKITIMPLYVKTFYYVEVEITNPNMGEVEIELPNAVLSNTILTASSKRACVRV